MLDVNNVYLGDCLQVMQDIEDNYIDTIITDPPYGLKFMGKKWDYEIPSKEIFQEMLRVAKPGALLLCFGGTRTWHRIAVNIEDAGWELRDTIMWVYGSGFPKSMSISKAIDKAESVEREVVGKMDVGPDIRKDNFHRDNGERMIADITVPATDLAKLWDGYGTALKPAHEPIIMAMKPLDGTYVENIKKWKVGGLNIDGGRIETQELSSKREHKGKVYDGVAEGYQRPNKSSYTHKSDWSMEPLGRFPANFIHDGSEEVLALFPDSKGQQGDVKGTEKSHTGDENGNCYGVYGRIPQVKRGDSGSAARFFYCAKASKSERGEGNNHPTVKPLALMEYLCKLTKTPTGGIVLDPFGGSGTTGLACKNVGRDFILIEQDKHSVEIAYNRLGISNNIKEEVIEKVLVDEVIWLDGE